MTPEAYCRELESYLCRKNDGHLIRIVGPSFERVLSWAAQGIPFKIACQGIDRYFERYYAKGTRRRPVQIDFCEHDVLDAFDAWRRAVGLRVSESQSDGDEEHSASRRSLPRHLDRVREKISARRAEPVPPALDAVFQTIEAETAVLRDQTGRLRGEAREQASAKLHVLDRTMLEAARELVEPASLLALRAEAAEQLRPFRDRMTPEVYDRAIESAVDRLIREREGLPTVAFDAT